MTATSPTDHPSPVPDTPAELTEQFAAPAATPVANAAIVGLPMFVAGSIALALNLTNYVPQAVVGAPVAILVFANGLGLLVGTMFAMRAGETAVGGVFALFAGFWLSYATLVFGLVHNWFGIPPAEVGQTIKAFVLTWLIVFVLLTLGTLRLPVAFTAIFALVDLALLFVLLAYSNLSAAGAPDETELKIGGYFVWAFAAVGAYAFLDAMSAATGGKNLPLGPALLK